MDDSQWFGFSLDYTQTCIYTIIDLIPGTVARFKTVDGSIDLVKTCSLLSGEAYAISMSPNSQTVYFSASSGSSISHLWKWQIEDNDFDWVNYNGIDPAEIIISSDSNVAYFIDFNQSTQNLEFKKVDFSNTNTEVWMSQITCTSWSVSYDDDLYFDSDLQTIYALGKIKRCLFCF